MTDTAPTPTPRRYQLTHVTEYRYSDDVTSSFGRAHLIPRDLPGQRRLATSIAIAPEPAEQRDHADYYGNTSTYFAVLTPHRTLRVSSRSEVEIAPSGVTADQLNDLSWQDARDRAESDPLLGEFLVDSPLVRAGASVSDYASATFAPGRPLGQALLDLVSRINRDFEYTTGTTTVRTTLGEVLKQRKGVCQDFAHLAVGCLRSVGLPARYTSGYLETEPPPGQAKLQGADASHAWAEVMVAGNGWIGLDPTNNQLVDQSYVIAAWGRDYTDVPPLKGVITTDARKSSMHVSVDVIRVT